MADPLREPGYFTEHQLRAVAHPGDMLLVACPGSGKTRTGGGRIARLAEEGQRVAACSYTNVGVEQIRSVLSGDLGVALGPEHFVGTLHRFLLTYVFFPFGHLVMGCSAAPKLAADESALWPDVVYGGDHRKRLRVSKLRLRPDDSLVAKDAPLGMSREAAAAAEAAQVMRLKSEKARQSFATFDDSMYWALKVLVDHPFVREAVAGRFDELIVDEAQDTSELQLACLDQLCTAGLKSLVLIGDIQQSIYSFQGASPEGCMSLAEAKCLEEVELTENHRSSQLICDVAAKFCDRAPDVAVGQARDCPWPPRLLQYEADRPSDAVKSFTDELMALGIDAADTAVLTRGNDFKDLINGHTDPVDIRPLPKAVGRACAALRGHSVPTRRLIEGVEAALLRVGFDADLAVLDAGDRWELRKAAMAFITELPDLENDLRQWIRDSCRVLHEHATVLAGGSISKRASDVFKSSADQEGLVAREAFAPSPNSLLAQTIHDVKGDSRDAVLVVIPPARGRAGRKAQASLWHEAVTGQETTNEEAEERRVGFVALTRARRFCAVAVPSSLPDEMLDALTAAGFSETRS